MNLEQQKILINQHLKQEDELVGYFQATYLPSLWWFLLVGPLLFLALRVYYVAVSKEGLYFHRFNFFGKPDQCDVFQSSEVLEVKIGKGLIQCPIKFSFSNGVVLKLKAQLKGVKKIPKLTPELANFLKIYQK